MHYEARTLLGLDVFVSADATPTLMIIGVDVRQCPYRI
jgi:hypothetical protein